MDRSIGISVWDGARISPLKCPCCTATARFHAIQPPSGAGPSHFRHRCTRCRHEWETDENMVTYVCDPKSPLVIGIKQPF